MAVIVVERGDITLVEADAIVNAANERMLGGGGVDGAIHRAAGPELVEACRRVPEVIPGVRCPTGEARITPAFGTLRAKWVVHTVGPVYSGTPNDAALLANAFRSSLKIAHEHGARHIAFPAVSCGVYGYPAREAAQISVAVVREANHEFDWVRFVLFSEELERTWREAI